jgi:aspartate kinase
MTMKTIIAKFGGSSVADPARIRACAARIAEMAKRGDRVAVVVSAMGDTTDDLLELAAEITDTPDKRELDQLMATGEVVSVALFAMALHAIGVNAVSLTGQQCGIATEPTHTRARIARIDPACLEREWAAGRVAVVAGFQGFITTDDGRTDTTTLGRGGSDTTAVALAAAVNADECLIFTDVDGVYTADPRIVPDARLIRHISYDEMMEAASQGAKVMHLRAVELGKKHGVPIRVLHSQGEGRGGGTLIAAVERHQKEAGAADAGPAVSTVALKTDIGRVTLSNLPNRAGLQRDIFERLGTLGVMVDDIIQTEDGRAGIAADSAAPRPAAAPAMATGSGGGAVDAGGDVGEGANGRGIPDLATIVFTVEKTDLADIRPVIDRALAEIGQGECRVDLGLAKVSAVGVGMQSQSGVAGRLFRALGDSGIRVANITTSEIKISCIVDERDGKPALRAVHHAFGLHLEPVVTRSQILGDRVSKV